MKFWILKSKIYGLTLVVKQFFMFGSPEDMTLFTPNVTFILFCCVGLETTMYRPWRQTQADQAR